MPESSGKQRGRPRKAMPKTVAIVVKVSAEDRDKLHVMAENKHVSLSEYCRNTLLPQGNPPEDMESRLKRIEDRLSAIESR